MMPLDRSRIPTTHSCKGGVIPLLVHGETNADFQDLLKVCARMAVSRGNTGGGGEAAKSKSLVQMEYRQDGCITKNIDFRMSWTEGCCPRAENDDEISCWR